MVLTVYISEVSEFILAIPTFGEILLPGNKSILHSTKH